MRVAGSAAGEVLLDGLNHLEHEPSGVFWLQSHIFHSLSSSIAALRNFVS
jgi:hypothetical protein